MTDAKFVTALAFARNELARLRREHQQLDLEIAKMSQLVAALKPVAEPDSNHRQGDIGLTDAVRDALRGAERPLAPPEIRGRLLAGRFNENHYRQFLPAVHVVLKRLVSSGEAMELDDGAGKKYWWSLNGPPPNREFVQALRTHATAIGGMAQRSPRKRRETR